jgi:hypothetical protein
MGWASIWAIFSPTHLVTLIVRYRAPRHSGLCFHAVGNTLAIAKKSTLKPGLPDGFYSDQKFQLGN